MAATRSQVRPAAAAPAPVRSRSFGTAGFWRRPGEWVEAGAVVALLALLVVLVPAGLRGQDARAAVPSGFSDNLVANIGVPTAMAFTPNGKMLVTTQGGLLKVVQGFQTPGGSITVADALSLSGRVCSDFERGLLGVAVDPGFSSNGFIYLFYTFKKHGVCPANTATSPVNRVSRFTMSGNSVSQASEVVLLDNMPSPNGNHNAGDLNFGPDGFLYVSVGDGGCDYAGNSGCGGANDAARDPHALVGKILRITRSGGIPSSNPYAGTGDRCNATGRTTAGRRCQETYASGLRNPFRFAFDPSGSRFYINDVGQNAWEEIDLGAAGADYGWNVREGPCVTGSTTNCGPTSFTNPIYAYSRSSGCGSITGGAFVPLGVWPVSYDGSYLFSDYVCGKIFRRAANGGVSDFATGLGGSSAVHLEFGPYNNSQALYYTTYAGGGQVRRIHFTGQANRPPVAKATASPTFGPLPLTVQFDGRGSSDPDGDPLTFSWNFGDGTPAGSGAQVSHTYTTRGTYTVTLTVRDNRGGSNSTTLRIDAGNSPPAPVITAPTTSDLYSVGQRITLTGRATDAEDGTLPNSALSWEVIIHHGSHTHPFLPPTTGNNVTFVAPAPEDLAATTNSYLEIRLTATDRAGLKKTIGQNFQPRTVPVSFRTSPSGLTIEVNGIRITAPRQITSWAGYVLNVNAPVQMDANGRLVQCTGWSDGSTCRHAIVTPAEPSSYTATFGPAAVPNSAPVADAYVSEANPNTNYGRGWTLRAEGGSDPDLESYLRFDVTGVTGPVGRATLWLYAADGSVDGPAVYGVGNAWEERTITWRTRPARTTGGLADVGRVPSGTWVGYDVTRFVTGNGRFSFALVSTSTDLITFHSRDYRANHPRLVIEGDTEPPTAPRGLIATVPTGQTNRIDLRWQAATDNVRVTGYEVERNGRIIARVGAVTTYQDTTVAPLTTYTYRVRARDASGNRSAWSNHYRITTPGATAGTFIAEADSRVNEARPTSNYGPWSTVMVDGGADPEIESYLRFTVSGITGPITSARLRVYVAEGTSNGPAVYTAGNAWTETGITWNNRPARSATGRDDKGALATGAWVEFDVTPWVTANGTYTFVLATTSTDDALFGSREGLNKPRLIINGASAAGLGAAGVAPTASPTPSPTPSPTATPAATATAAAWQPFADGFETGTLAAWTEATGLVIEPDPTRGNGLTVRARRSGAEAGPAATGTFARRVLAPPQPELYVRLAFDRVAAGEAPVALFQLRNEAGATVLTLALDRDGALLIRDAAGNQTTSWVKAAERGWHDVRVRARTDPAGGPGLVELWFDGRLVHQAPAVLGTAPLAELVLGDAAFVPGRAYDLAFDDVAVDVRCLGACSGELVTPTPAAVATATPTATPEPAPTDTPAPAPSPTATPAPPTAVPTDTPVPPPPTATPPPPPPAPTDTPIPTPTERPAPAEDEGG